MKSTLEVEVELSKDEMKYVKILNSGTIKKPRQKFNVQLINLITHKLRWKYGLDCDFEFKSNWLQLPIIGGDFWRGSFYCKPKYQCKTFGYAKIRNEYDVGQSCFVHLNIQNIEKHEIRENIRMFHSGDQRKDTISRIFSQGLVNVRAQNVIDNHENPENLPKPTKPEVLRQMKYNHNHQERFSCSISVDVQAAKHSGSIFCLKPDHENGLIGHIQQIMSNPFGFVMISDLQIKLWLEIQKTNPVWYFDATSSVMVDVDGESRKPFLYSFVCHDFTKKCIIPVAEFITVDNTEDSVGTYVYMIKKTLQRHITTQNYFKWAPVVVTDFSWPLIYSILENFGGLTITQYLVWTYEVLVKKKEDLEKFASTIIYLCSTHILKIVIRKTDIALRNLKSNDVARQNEFKKIRTTFIISFGILQNAKTLEEFENILKSIVIIFYSKEINDSLLQSIATMRSAIRNRELITKIFSESRNEFICEKNVTQDIVFQMEKDFTNYKRESPFTDYFETRIDQFKGMCKTVNGKRNDLHCPVLIDILNDLLYITPLWSGMMINHLNKQYPHFVLPSRLSNNSVEHHFGKTKNHNLQNKKVPPSILSPRIYQNVQMKALLNYKDIISKPEKPKESQKVHCRNEVTKRQRKQPFYYERKEGFALMSDEEHEATINTVECIDFENLFNDYPDIIMEVDNPIIETDDSIDKFLDTILYSINSDDENDYPKYESKDVLDSISSDDKKDHPKYEIEDSLHLISSDDENDRPKFEKQSMNEANKLILNNSIYLPETDLNALIIIDFFMKYKPKWGGRLVIDSIDTTSKLINTCSIDYFLFAFWCVSKLNLNTISILSSLTIKHQILASIINKIDSHDWNAAKSILLTEIAGVEIDGNKDVDCFENEVKFLITHIVNFQLYHLVETCITCQTTKHFQSSSLLFERRDTQLILNIQDDCCFRCKTRCMEIFFAFKDYPLWLFVDTHANLVSNIYEIPKAFKFREKIYVLLMATIGSNGHFRAIFYLNKTFYLVDDLSDQISEKIPNHNLSWCFYYLAN